MSIFEDIYLSAQGFLVPEAALPWVENCFETGSDCDRAYEEMMQAYRRICDRLGVAEEDPDLEIILDRFSDMQRIMCQRMFEYGMGYVTGRHFLDPR